MFKHNRAVCISYLHKTNSRDQLHWTGTVGLTVNSVARLIKIKAELLYGLMHFKSRRLQF